MPTFSFTIKHLCGHRLVSVTGQLRRIPGQSLQVTGVTRAGVCLVSGEHRGVETRTPEREWRVVSRHDGSWASVQITPVCCECVRMFGTMSFRVNTVSLLLLNFVATIYCLRIKSINVPKYAKVSHWGNKRYRVQLLMIFLQRLVSKSI